jgi:putative SOS response-associated peptidase YedK
MATEIRYRWRYFDEASGRHCTTRHHCTESQIRVEHPDATPVDGSRDVLELTENWLVNSTSHFQQPRAVDNEAMCGRYALYGPISRNRDHFQVDDWPDFPDRYNIAPSLSVPVIRQAPDGRRVADLLRWGLIPNWAKDPSIGAKLNNARSESVAEKPSFRSAYRRRRCIVPASGFYEWQAVPGQTWKQPWYIHLKADEPMAMGGLWESWTDPASGEILRTFCVITTAANEIMAPIHDRMPVILRPADWVAWLAPGSAMEQVAPLVVPAPADSMEAWAVSRKVSSAREEGPELIEPA